MYQKFSTMTKRERVETAMNLQHTDRTPVYDLLFSDTLIEYFSGSYPPIGEQGLKYKCKAISSMLDMTRCAWMGPVEPGETVSSDGFIHKYGRWMGLGYKKKPFNNVDEAVKWLQNKVNIMKNEKHDFKKIADDFRERFIRTQKYIEDDTVMLHDENGTGLDQLRHALGLELFSYLWVDYPELISEYMELYTKYQVNKIHAIADYSLSPCALTYGDIAHKTGLLHSPEWLRKEFMPRVKKLNDAWHEHGVKCLFHSDGNIMEVMDDLIEIEIDGLNPIETMAGMDLAVLKKRYGNKIFFAGGIDMSQLLSKGTPDEVYEASRNAIMIASPGYFIGSTSELQNTAKLENVLTMLRTAGLPI